MSDGVFIDCHCHLFNIVDVPVYATLAGKVPMGTLQRLTNAFAANFAITSGMLQSKIDQYEDFVRFFERPIEKNVRWLSDEVGLACQNKTTPVLLTPLIMDFDEVDNSPHAGKPSVEAQLLRLVAAIGAAGDTGTTKIYPFIGLDLRKLEEPGGETMAWLEKLWRMHGISAAQRKKGVGAMPSGKVLGIKLYPPLGFDPYPSRKQKKDCYLAFYRWCCERDIAITVHCQPDSYSVGSSQRTVNRRTHAANWRNLFDKNEDIRNLRINFAHFGGENGFEDLFDWYRRGGIERNCWVDILIHLLQDYPNAYADVSAYDFVAGEARRNFRRLLDKNTQSAFGSGDFNLTEKMLWGSDVPMVMSCKGYRTKKGHFSYKRMYQCFQDTVNGADRLSAKQKRDLIKRMTSTNPANFLGI